MNVLRVPLWPALPAGIGFAVLHATLQRLRGGPVDPALAALSGLALALAWAGPGLWAVYRVGQARYSGPVAPRAAAIVPGESSGDRSGTFTDRARKVLQYAQEEAQRFTHNYIGTEHLLLGLVRERDGVAARALADLGIDLDTVRTSVEYIIGRGYSVEGNLGLTPRAKKVLELAVGEARRLNHQDVGTEHLLLGLVREGEGIAASILESQGVSLHRVREQVLYVLNQAAAPRGPSEQTGNRTTGAVSWHQVGGDRIARFSDGARKVMQYAQEEAQRLSQNYVGSEHLLVGLLAERQGLAAQALADVGLDLDHARHELAKLSAEGDAPPRQAHVGLSDQARGVIDQSTRVALERDAQEVKTEHLLLCVLELDDAPGVRLLERLGTDRAAVRAAVERRARLTPEQQAADS